jgi:PilZ domain
MIRLEKDHHFIPSTPCEGANEVYHERRREKRKKINIPILIKLGNIFSGRGITKNISKHGLCLKSLQIFKGFNNIQFKDLTGFSIKVMIPTEGITINGSIVWVDLKNGEGAISILNTSDDNRWQKLCE